MTHHRIQQLLDARELRRCTPDEARVADEWNKAVGSWSYDRTTQSPPPAHDRIEILYSAGRRAATAILLCAGYELADRSSSRHRNTFHALRGLETPQLEEAAHHMDAQRQLRHQVMYRGGEELGTDELDDLQRCVEELLLAGYDYMVGRMPRLENSLANPSDPSQ